MVEAALLTFICTLAMAGAAYDFATLTIPNWISLSLLALFPALAIAAGLSLSETGMHFAVGAGALAVGVALFAGGVIGGGDAKLFAALALYMGAQSIGPYVFAVALAGGALAVGLLLVRSLPVRIFLSRFRAQWVHRLTSPGVGIPYGVAIAAGGLFVLPGTHFLALVAAP